MIWRDHLTSKCSEQTSVPPAIVYSLPSSQRIPWIHYLPVDADVEQFLSLLLAFKNTKTSRHSEIKQTRPSTKQKFSGEALSKQNTEASLASLSWNSSRRWPSGPPYLHSVYTVIQNPNKPLEFNHTESLKTQLTSVNTVNSTLASLSNWSPIGPLLTTMK